MRRDLQPGRVQGVVLFVPPKVYLVVNFTNVVLFPIFVPLGRMRILQIVSTNSYRYSSEGLV